MKKSDNLLTNIEKNKIRVQPLADSSFNEKKITVSVARLDELHPVISGNKYFKLKYNIEEALKLNCDAILTFGGAYSNHLAACSYFCKKAGLRSIGIIRGEKAENLSHTLQFCQQNGMDLVFVSRKEYQEKQVGHFIDQIKTKYPSAFIIPEGGNNELAIKGLKEILPSIPSSEKFTHIITAIGTGSTFSGLIASCFANQIVEGILVLKSDALAEELKRKFKVGKHSNNEIITDFHFGGYAKKNLSLIDFMNLFHKKYSVPTDFVYTAKIFFGVIERINNNLYPPGSDLLILHTGGLQGNVSLPKGIIHF